MMKRRATNYPMARVKEEGYPGSTSTSFVQVNEEDESDDLTLHPPYKRPFHFPRGHSPRTAKIGDNSFEAQLSQPFPRRLATQPSLSSQGHFDTPAPTYGVYHESEERRSLPQTVDWAPSKQSRFSFPPSVSTTRLTATAFSSDPQPHASPPTPVSLQPTTEGNQSLAQAHRNVDKLTRKAFRTNRELEKAQRESKALEDAGEVVRLRNQLQEANARIASLKSDITAKTRESTRYWSSKARIMQNEHEVEMKEKDDKIRYLEAKLKTLEKEVENLRNAKTNDTSNSSQTNNKVDASSAYRRLTRKSLRNHTRNEPSMRSFSCPRQPFSGRRSSMKIGVSSRLDVALQSPYQSISGIRKSEESSGWNVHLTPHSAHEVQLANTIDSAQSNEYCKQAESGWLPRNRRSKSYMICPASKASQRNPEETCPVDIYDQLPDICDLDMERDVGPEEGDEVLVNGVKMRYLVGPEAEKKPHGLDPTNRDIEILAKEEDDSQDGIEEDALGIEEWDGFDEQDWDGFGVQNLEEYGVADDDGFGVADDDGYEEVDLEGYGCEEYEGFGVEDDDGFLIEEDDGLFVC